MRIKKYEETWYFETGFLVTKTEAIYKLAIRQLTIVRNRHLRKIIKYLQDNLDVNEISVIWYKESPSLR